MCYRKLTKPLVIFCSIGKEGKRIGQILCEFAYI
jgi:hypothetical protein